MKKSNIPYIKYDKLHDGRRESVSEAAFNEDFTFLSTAIQSSEGENIIMNISKLSSEVGNFVKTGNVIEKNPFIRAFKSTNGYEKEKSNFLPERWILLDAVDSGLSVDNIVDIKEYLFKTILDNNFGNEIYIIVSANKYEMARNEQCTIFRWF